METSTWTRSSSTKGEALPRPLETLGQQGAVTRYMVVSKDNVDADQLGHAENFDGAHKGAVEATKANEAVLGTQQVRSTAGNV